MDGVAAFINALREKDVRLWLDGGELRYQAPKGAMDAALLQQLREHKPALLAFLGQATLAAGPALPEPSPMPADAPPLLSYAQQRLWFLDRLEGATPTYNILAAFRFTGALDVERLRRSFDWLARRHESLRTTFTEDATGLATQKVAASLAVPLTVLDHGHLPPQQRDAELARLKAAESERCFDLERGPLLALTLVNQGEAGQVLLLAMHHIIGDGWSMGVLAREFGLAYSALGEGGEPSVAPLLLQYRDYAYWQRQPAFEALVQQQLQRWQNLLQGAPYQLDIDTGRARPEEKSYHGARRRFVVAAATRDKLKALAQSNDASLFMVLLAAYFVLLQRYSGRNDLLVGTQVANRGQRALEPLIGFFINTLVLRAKLDGALSFAGLLRQVRGFCLQAFELQDTPFERLVEALQPERSFGYNPLVQVMFLWQNAPMDAMALPGLAVRREPLEAGTSKFDLTLEMGELQDGLEGILEYSTDLFDDALMERMGEHYLALLQAIADAPETALGNLVVGWAPPAKALEPAIASQADYPNLAAAFAAQARRTPERLALCDAGQSLSYRQLANWAGEVAEQLRAAGAAPEQRVAVCLPRGAGYVAAILGSLRAGCAYVPLEPGFPAERIDYILRDAGVSLLLADAKPAFALPEGVAWLPMATDYLESGGEPDQSEFFAHPDGLAYVIYTSGSTGRPKGVAMEHGPVLKLVDALIDEIYRPCSDQPLRVGLMASFVFDASVQQIFAALLRGHTLCVASEDARRDEENMAEFFAGSAIDLADCTPSLLALMVQARLPERTGVALRHLIVGGEAFPSRLARDFWALPGGDRVSFSNVYGPTECCVDVSLHRAEPDRAYAASALPLGAALGQVSLQVLDGQDNPAPPGVLGQIHIGGPTLARGYWNQPRLTAERFIPAAGGGRRYRSGDLGRWNERGELEFCGRTDDQVKVRGYRIELGEIEARLAALAGVSQACVVLDGQGELLAYLAGEAGLTVASLRDGLARSLPDYMLPSRFVLLDKLPLNASGKVARRALPPPGETRRLELGSDFAAPATQKEEALLAVWREVLGFPAIGCQDNYFAVGGDSIKALQISARLRAAGWRLHVRDLFSQPTVRALAPLLTPLAEAPAEAAVASGEAPPTPIQLDFFQGHGGAYAHFNQSFLLHPQAALDGQRLRAALEAVAAHHEAFRLRYQYQGGRWRQFYADSPAVGFETVDLAGPAAELTAHATALQAAFALDSGPLFKAVLYRCADGERLLLCAHHLMVDGVSWRVLMEDLQAAYGQLQRAEPVSLPAATADFQAWSALLRNYAQSMSAAERRYWRFVAEQCGTEVAGPPTRYRDLALAGFSLTAEETRAFLTRAHHAYATEANDILLAALALAYREYSGQQRLALLLEGHGRDAFDEQLDLSRGVGWFTTRYPVVLDAAAGGDLGRLVKTVKETLRAVPNKGVGYGVLKHLAAEPLQCREPKLSFNYLGQFAQEAGAGMFRLAGEGIGPNMAPDAHPPFAMEWLGKIVDGRLAFELAYNSELFAESAAAALCLAYQNALRRVLEHVAGKDEAELTPADIDYDGFDVDQLDQFLDQLS